MRVSLFFLPFLSASLLLNAARPVRAQNETATAATPPTVPVAPPKPAPPEDRNAARRAQNEIRLRTMMKDFGIEAAASQDALIAYLAEDETGRGAVRGAARRLMGAVRNGAQPNRMRDLLAIYKAALDADRERRRAAQSALDAKIGFSLNPRLEATLWLLGVLGEGQSGLPGNAFSVRPPRNGPNDGPKDGNHDGNRDGERNGNREAGAPRNGVVMGLVKQKAEGWLEVQDEKGTVERYFPFGIEENRTDPVSGAILGKEDAARLNRAVLETLTRVQIGQRVRLQWVWNDCKRVAQLEILPPADAPEDVPYGGH